LMSTVADAVAEFDACDEVAVGGQHDALGRPVRGPPVRACTSTFFPASEAHGCTWTCPMARRRRTWGLTLLGFADSVILAEPSVLPASQTLIALPDLRARIDGAAVVERLNRHAQGPRRGEWSGWVVGVAVGVGGRRRGWRSVT